jgi:hypothetical protein
MSSLYVGTGRINRVCSWELKSCIYETLKSVMVYLCILITYLFLQSLHFNSPLATKLPLTSSVHCLRQHASYPAPVTLQSQPTFVLSHTQPASCSSKIRPKASAPSCTQIRKWQVCVPLGVLIRTAITWTGGFHFVARSDLPREKSIKTDLREMGLEEVSTVSSGGVVSQSVRWYSHTNQPVQLVQSVIYRNVVSLHCVWWWTASLKQAVAFCFLLYFI